MYRKPHGKESSRLFGSCLQGQPSVRSSGHLSNYSVWIPWRPRRCFAVGIRSHGFMSSPKMLDDGTGRYSKKVVIIYMLQSIRKQNPVCNIYSNIRNILVTYTYRKQNPVTKNIQFKCFASSRISSLVSPVAGIDSEKPEILGCLGKT